MSKQWIKVTRTHKCPVCNKPDWCCVGERFINCMRVASSKPCANGGWLHALSEPIKPVPVPSAPAKVPVIDAGAIMRGFSADTWPAMQAELARSLGVSRESLQAIGCAWAPGYNAWAFPMKNWQGDIIGLRLRDETGHKWAVRGSRAGLFYSEGEAPEAYLCEGPTDTAAAISIGLHAIGRPSCVGQETEILLLLKRKQVRRLTILCDNDDPGWQGAEKLSAMLPMPHVILIPPARDVREFVRQGGLKETLDVLVHSLVWRTNRNNNDLTRSVQYNKSAVNKNLQATHPGP